MAKPVEYETQRWTDDQRMAFERLLKWSRITYEWLKDGSLAVDPSDENRVDALLDQFTSGEFSEEALDELIASDSDNDGDQSDDEADDGDEASNNDADRGFQAVSAAQVEGEFDQGFAALVSLYEATEAFARNAVDDVVRGTFQRAAQAIDVAEQPFGWEEDTWDFVCDRAALISSAISDEVDPEVLEVDARGFREVLVRFL